MRVVSHQTGGRRANGNPTNPGWKRLQKRCGGRLAHELAETTIYGGAARRIAYGALDLRPLTTRIIAKMAS